MKITFTHVLFQSFSSIGPFLDFVALFPLMALYGGKALPEVTMVSFAISFLTLLPIIIFTGISHSNEGYASYASLILGNKIGGFTGIIYILYSVLVLPNIIMFLSSFVFPFSSLKDSFKVYFYFAFSFIHLVVIMALLSKGLRWTITPIVILGLIEVGSIIGLSLFMIYTSHGVISNSPITEYFTGNFWDGVMVGILMFSGGGSGIFLQRDADLSKIRIRKPLIISYLMTGFSLIMASFAITLFLGSGIYQYGLDPGNLFNRLADKSSSFLIIFLMLLLFISGFNLTLSYGNALLQMSQEFLSRIMEKTPTRFILSLFLLILSSIVLAVSYLTEGFYTSFLIIAVFISMLYVTVHIITGISLVKANFSFKLRLAGLISLVVLLFSIIESMESSSVYESTLLLFYTIAILSSLMLVMRIKFKSYPSKKIDYNDFK
ncbi:hypothetical protein ACNF42_00845 [Cuniculiplasma sp. SKW3]|uniref:hypothetical protein n=1 Tax=Cuniculiplasma sp. SKW3 TaxID=3400170 RepID=UPI003FD24D28